MAMLVAMMAMVMVMLVAMMASVVKARPCAGRTSAPSLHSSRPHGAPHGPPGCPHAAASGLRRLHVQQRDRAAAGL
eukprot:11201842-Lingulodinium_polyedra.AAC.1